VNKICATDGCLPLELLLFPSEMQDSEGCKLQAIMDEDGQEEQEAFYIAVREMIQSWRSQQKQQQEDEEPAQAMDTVAPETTGTATRQDPEGDKEFLNPSLTLMSKRQVRSGVSMANPGHLRSTQRTFWEERDEATLRDYAAALLDARRKLSAIKDAPEFLLGKLSFEQMRRFCRDVVNQLTDAICDYEMFLKGAGYGAANDSVVMQLSRTRTRVHSFFHSRIGIQEENHRKLLMGCDELVTKSLDWNAIERAHEGLAKATAAARVRASAPIISGGSSGAPLLTSQLKQKGRFEPQPGRFAGDDSSGFEIPAYRRFKDPGPGSSGWERGGSRTQHGSAATRYVGNTLSSTGSPSASGYAGMREGPQAGSRESSYLASNAQDSASLRPSAPASSKASQPLKTDSSLNLTPASSGQRASSLLSDSEAAMKWITTSKDTTVGQPLTQSAGHGGQEHSSGGSGRFVPGKPGSLGGSLPSMEAAAASWQPDDDGEAGATVVVNAPLRSDSPRGGGHGAPPAALARYGSRDLSSVGGASSVGQSIDEEIQEEDIADYAEG